MISHAASARRARCAAILHRPPKQWWASARTVAGSAAEHHAHVRESGDLRTSTGDDERSLADSIWSRITPRGVGSRLGDL